MKHKSFHATAAVHKIEALAEDVFKWTSESQDDLFEGRGGL
ncbi:MAG: hypothetical protein ABJZ55_08115 [Fuerstiella sp.]